MTIWKFIYTFFTLFCNVNYFLHDSSADYYYICRNQRIAMQ